MLQQRGAKVNTIDIAGRKIGNGYEPFVILEVGINHNGDMQIIRKMIDEAFAAGADAIKFQTFKAEEFIADPNQTYTYRSGGLEITEPMLEMFRRYELSETQWRQIFLWCKQSNILCFSTPQNPSDLDFLLSIVDLPVIKVGSDDLTNLELMRYYAGKGLPMIISAGMAYISEVEAAVRSIRASGNEMISILHCVSSYPASARNIHLNKIATLQRAFDVPVGFSDHTEDNNAAVASVAMGACILEKHFTLDKNMPGPDHWFSMNPTEAKAWVRAIKDAYCMLGKSVVEPTAEELTMRKIARRSIVANNDIAAGTVLTRKDLALKRPGTGIPPAHIDYLIGQRLAINIRKNELITFENLRVR
jgi:N,N'-diacetyllegionaminate synthase